MGDLLQTCKLHAKQACNLRAAVRSIWVNTYIDCEKHWDRAASQPFASGSSLLVLLVRDSKEKKKKTQRQGGQKLHSERPLQICSHCDFEMDITMALPVQGFRRMKKPVAQSTAHLSDRQTMSNML